MTDLDTSRVIIVSSNRGLRALKVWLTDRKYNDVFPWLTDKAGNRMVGLNAKDRETRQFTQQGLVIVRDSELIGEVIRMCNEGKTNDPSHI